MQKTVLILAGGKSLRFQQHDKCFISLNNKPLLLHAIDSVSNIADEIIVAARDRKQGEQIRHVIRNKKISLVFDSVNNFGPLAGILSGLECASSEYALVIGCDMPCIKSDVVEFLFEIASTGYDAVVPRWENGMVEPLHAVYRTEPMLAAIKAAPGESESKVLTILSQLKNVDFLPMDKIRVIDPSLETFTNINTLDELKRYELLMRR